MLQMNTYVLEQVVKGFSNHRRIEVLEVLSNDTVLSLEQLAEACKSDYKTLSVHLARMVRSGLITKRYAGRQVEHRITPLGNEILTFLRKLV